MSTNNTFEVACRLASRIKELAPWSYLVETDIFGVRMPETGQRYFVSVMGAAGEHFGLAAYVGAQGLLDFFELREPMPWKRPGELLLIPHLSLSFENKDDIDAPVRKKMKDLGYSFRGNNAWPDFKQIMPGFVPSMPEEDALNDLVVIMEQSADVFSRAKTDAEFLFPEGYDDDVYLVREMTEKGKNAGQWADVYWEMELPKVDFELVFDMLERKRISGLPRLKDTLMADIALLPHQVAEPGKKPYFASIFVVVSKQSGMVLDFETLTPLEGIDAMHARFPNLLIKALLKLKVQPASIEIRHPVFFEMAKKILHPTKIKVHLVPELPQVDELLEGLASQV